MAKPVAGGGETLDAFFGGRLRIAQPAVGYRAGLDAVLLAAAVPAGARLLEAGCGVGVALLGAALRHPQARLVGVERAAEIAALAAANVQRNNLQERVAIVAADALAETGGGFDGVFCNPPYYAPGRGQAPAVEKRHAYLADQPVDRWIARLADRLVGGGAFTMIHRADALGDILAGLKGRLGGVCVLPIHPKAAQPAHRVIVRAFKASRAGMTILPGLIAHRDDGSPHPDIAACVTDLAPLPFLTGP